jgi:hypothetical protein
LSSSRSTSTPPRTSLNHRPSWLPPRWRGDPVGIGGFGEHSAKAPGMLAVDCRSLVVLTSSRRGRAAAGATRTPSRIPGTYTLPKPRT